MRLESLSISRVGYGEDEGVYTGTARFHGNHGEVALRLTRDLSQIILKACAEELVKASKDVAELLTTEVLETTAEVKQIENQDDENPF